MNTNEIHDFAHRGAKVFNVGKAIPESSKAL
jgi:hypothetical protein